MDDFRIWPKDLRRVLFCSVGARAFFARHKLNFRAFVREGIPAETLLKTGDAMARHLVESARGRK